MDEDLFSAIEGENYRLARDLITKGARSDTLVRNGLSALHLISGYESQDASKILEYCAKESDTNVKSSEGLTPLHIAALWGRLHNLKILIRYGGDINMTDDDGNNALDLASLSGENESEGCVKFLLELELQKSKPSSAAKIASGESIIDSPEKYHEQSTEDFSESFFTAVGDESMLDHTVVTFPKLHPWNVKTSSTDFDVTVIDNMNDLSITDCRFADPDVSDNTVFEEGYKEQSFTEQVSIDDPEFGDTTIFYDWKECSSIMPADEMTDHNESVVIPESLQHLSTPELRKKLQERGEIPGPITPVTRNVYIKRLARLNSGTTILKDSQFKEYLPELRKHMEGRVDTPDLCLEEESMCLDFDLKKSWREGTEKSSFNYLLIDPRVTQNLPVRGKKMDPDDAF